MTGNSNTVTITLRVKDDGTFEVASGKMRALGDKVGSLGPEGGKATSAMRTLQSAMIGLGGAAVTLAGAAGLGALVFALNNSVKAASDLQEAANKFDVVFKGQEQAAARWAKTLVDSYAMSTRESKQYLSGLQDLLVPMGMAKEEAGNLSFQIVKLAADLGSFNNLPTADVIRDIQSALVGQYETVRKYGASLDAATVQQVALNMGLAKSKDELTAANKAQAAFQLILQTNEAALGDMARTADSYANQVKKLQSNTEDFRATLGGELLPVFTELVQEINAAFQANEGLLAQNIGQWFAELARSGIMPCVEAAAKLADWLATIAGMPISTGNLEKSLEIRAEWLRDKLKELSEGQAQSIFPLIRHQAEAQIEQYKQQLVVAESELNAIYDKLHFKQKQGAKGVYDYATELERMAGGSAQQIYSATASGADKMADKIRSAEEKLAKDILQLHGDTFDGQVALLDAERKGYETLNVDKEKLAAWYNEKHAKLVEEQTEKEKTEYEKRLKEAEEYWQKVAELGDEATGAIFEQQIRTWESRGGEWYEFVDDSASKMQETNEKTYDQMTDRVEGFYDDLFGNGEGFEVDFESMLKRIKGMLIKYMAEMTTYWLFGMRTMAEANLAVAATAPNGMTIAGGGTTNQVTSALGGNNSSGFNLFSGGASTALSALYRIPGMAGILGTTTSLTGGFVGGLSSIPLIGGNLAAGVGGIGAFMTGAGGVGSLLSGVMSLAGPIGLALGIASLFGGNLFGKDHTYRRIRRGGEWSTELSNMAGAESWGDVTNYAENYPIYFNRGEGGSYIPFTPSNEDHSAFPQWSTGLKIQDAGYKYTDLKDEMTKEEYYATLANWDDIMASSLNTLNDEEEATIATAAALADYKDEIELTKDSMEDWGETGQEAAQAMIDMYNHFRAFTIADLTEQFSEGKITLKEFEGALDLLDLTPLEQATTVASAALSGLLKTAELGSEEFYQLYDVYQQNISALTDLATASQDMTTIQNVLASGADLTQEQLLALVEYYRLLQQAIDGTIKSYEDLEAARAGVSSILDADAIATWKMVQMALNGMNETQVGWATANSRYGFAGGDNTATGLIEWAKTATYAELEAYAKQMGIEVNVLVSDLQWMDAAIKDSATAAREAADAYKESVKQTGYSLEQARLKLRGGSDEDLQWLGIRQRWGWEGDNAKSEKEIRAGIDWFMNEAKPEDILWLATQKGMSVDQFKEDILFMGEQLGYFGDAVNDATDSIRNLEQAAASWRSLSQSLTEQIRGIAFSEANPQTAVQRMGLVYQTIQGITGGQGINSYLGGITDVAERQDTIQELSDLWGEYLQLAQEAYQRPSNQYQREYDLTLQNLEALKDYSLSEYDVALRQLQALEQIAANTSPEVETPAGGDGAAATAGGGIGTPGTFGWNSGHAYTINYMPGVGEDVSITPSTAHLPPHYHWEANYNGNQKFWYALADAAQYAIPIYHQGKDYVPYPQFAYLDQAEAVLNPEQARAWRSGSGQQQISLSLAANITINGANKTGPEIKEELRSEMRAFLRDEGGKMVEDIIKYSGVVRRG